MKLLLIRHGQTQANIDGLVSSWAPGEELTELGHQQAETLATTLADAAIDGVFASTLIRAQQSAAPLARTLDQQVVIVDGLHEIEAGEFEGGATREQMIGYLTPMGIWGTGDLTAAHPGAFDGNHFLARFDRAIEEIVKATGTDGTAAVITHSGCIGVWVAGRANNVTPDFSASHHLGNTDMVELVGDPVNGWEARSWAGAPVSTH